MRVSAYNKDDKAIAGEGHEEDRYIKTDEDDGGCGVQCVHLAQELPDVSQCLHITEVVHRLSIGQVHQFQQVVELKGLVHIHVNVFPEVQL